MSPKIFKMTWRKRLASSLQDKTADPFSVKEGHFRFGQLRDSAYYSDWTEQSFLSDTGHKEMVSFTFNLAKLKYFAAVGVLVLSVLLMRAAWLQVVKNDYYYSLSEDNRLRVETVEAKRGIIYDRNLRPLVRNKANFVLYLRPIDLPKNELSRDELVREISQILENGAISATNTPLVATDTPLSLSAACAVNVASDNATFYQIKNTLSEVKIGSLESYQPLFVAGNIEYDKAMLIALNLDDWPGVFLSDKIRREYLLPTASSTLVAAETSLAHVLGYTGKITEAELEKPGNTYSPIDYIGQAGLEDSYETELKGKPGRKNIEVDALGRQKKTVNEVPAESGANLLLALDFPLQQKTEEVAKSYLQRANLHRASIIIINPNNGEILTLVSLPDYNNNLFAAGISQTDYDKFLANPNNPLFNRSVSGQFPSGSTIKPIFAAAALQEKVISAGTTVMSSGGLRIGQWFFPDWKAGGHGLTDVRKALAQSVNTFFYYIGGGYGNFTGLGVEGLVKYSRLFGLGEKTGLDLPGEASGFVPTEKWKLETKNEPWYIGDTYHFAIGQGDVLVTPLQVANYIAAIANNGTLYQPHLVSKILNSDNQVIKEIAPQIINTDFIDSNNLQIVREGMRQTVTGGSAQSLKDLPIAVAGKTGTAQWSTTKSPHAWFVGFAPYEKPQIAIMVLVEEGVEGSTIAAPIARDILAWYFNPLGGGASATSTPPAAVFPAAD